MNSSYDVRTLVSALALAFGALALGAPAPAGAQAADPEQLTERVNQERPEEDETAWALSAGAVINTGNTRSWTANAGSNFRLVRGRHAFGAEWAFNYGRADLPDDGVDDYTDTARNSNLRLRYDLYLTRMDALFVALAHRWDTFAGLDTRLQGQVGYLRNFFREENHRAWGEVGYDITYDNFDPEAIQDPDTASDPMCDPAMGAPDDIADRPAICQADGSQIVHAARVYLGYENALNEHVRFLTGVEALLNLEEPEDLRINYDAALRSTIAGSLQVEIKFKLLYDNVPALQADGTEREKIDTTTTISLIYTLI
ncbi:MAG TPA: DUF481 domain-containing protein [Polyangiaceae bacterium LLY-WYZ-15_(1-7)]|nr:DUF481 domain-containing protein [Polyangiaceae bacterium LLY-WYZ-15_(1-7)]HJL06829.1 DUF481 domain-containing protein [Polyangiaceae bacterium LLY-WYZ-15_(1-7)]HJL12637.1 DUF481 domain-containing protein [Polyangiaceae bacterium LLY-WYZ-15_(1-7)]HJL21659.1 DUF481 domain-containing protein [Polyangiaceae bacterium LLY-WYZ-15_(1-7)]HJL31755.1 DUF481 domain-containing protein [Polyangiaceae bacterium LLY-WYZ-15_(1-7)]